MTPSPVIYQPLELGYIRVLHLAPGAASDNIVCSVSMVSLHDLPNYHALSYCWGERNGPRHLINLQGQPFQILQNLFSALQQLRYPDRERVLWIDALCINQEDRDERSQQVSLMQHIYEFASEVVIWLGIADCDSDLAMDTLGQISVELQSTSSQPPLEELTLLSTSCALTAPNSVARPEVSAAVNRFFKRPYFSRVWIVQEVMVPVGEINITCGTRIASLEAIMRAGIAFANYHTRRMQAISFNQNLRGEIHHRNLWVGRQGYQASKTGDEASKKVATLLRNVWRHRQRDCSDPKDRIFAFLGISIDRGKAPRPDYKESEERVFEEYAAYFIKDERSLRILSLCTLDTRHREIPSWVPDWTIEATAGPSHPLTQWYNPNAHKFSACGGHPYVVQYSSDGNSLHVSPDMKVLRAKGIQCLTISLLGDTLQDENANPGSVSAEMWQRLRTWLSLIEQHVADPYPTGESRSEATWRTILANVSSAGHLAQSDVEGLGFDLWSRIPQSNQELRSPTAQQAMIQFMGAASSATYKRRLFFTQEGYIGLAPKGARVGDQIYLLFGAEVPYVLRRKGDDLQTFEVVGECYCHGIMEGEMLAAGRTPSELKIV
jgi:hypothetical protein